MSNKECDYSIVNCIAEWCLNLHAHLQLQIIYDTILFIFLSRLAFESGFLVPTCPIPLLVAHSMKIIQWLDYMYQHLYL